MAGLMSGMKSATFWGAIVVALAGVSPLCHAAGTIQGASSWGYQLQNADPATLAASSYDVIVMDYSRDGTDDAAYTREEIQSIKDAGKTVLAYLSIGEAEDYRFYWKPAFRPGSPSWLGPENPEWEGNYKVRYWQSGWWRIALRPYLERILAAGFDGVYMDIIDAYWYWHEEKRMAVGLTSNRMVDLVAKIAGLARASSPGFILCPQNGESILDDAPSTRVRKRYLKVIDAIGVEDLFYHYGSIQDRKYRMGLLGEYAGAGKKVFNVEYVPRRGWEAYRSAACAVPFGMVPYAAETDRALDELVDFPRLECP